MSKFNLVALGGTFDIVHKGHLKLLSKAFSISSNIIIGLTSDDLAYRKNKTLENNYDVRSEKLKSEIEKNFPNSIYQIDKLENDFGPAVLEGKVEALVVSEETKDKGEVLNKLRREKNLPIVEIISVPMVLAEDGIRISTSRIKNSEIDLEGNIP